MRNTLIITAVLLLLDDHTSPEGYEEARKLAGENASISGKKYTRPGIASVVAGGSPLMAPKTMLRKAATVGDCVRAATVTRAGNAGTA